MEVSQPILSARELHRRFTTAEGLLLVLKGISLEINRGDMVAITGPSGVGKSTLLHLLGGLDRPCEGEVRIGDSLLNKMSESSLAALRNRRIGFIFQFHYLLEDFSATENVMIPVLLAGKEHGEARDRAELLLEDVGLTNRRTHRPHELSGGEQQRVAVARALANEPEVVLADEPSGNLDVGTGRRLHELLFQLNADRSTSFVIATHNRELADRCDREFQLTEGRLSE